MTTALVIANVKMALHVIYLLENVFVLMVGKEKTARRGHALMINLDKIAQNTAIVLNLKQKRVTLGQVNVIVLLAL